jgi:predicted RNA-binding Zn-ribbon protein involved in translation (DUF1610 family)
MRSEHDIACPFCGHIMTDDEIYNDPTDLWALAPNEDESEVVCPSAVCGETFIVKGSYRAIYETEKPEADDE